MRKDLPVPAMDSSLLSQKGDAVSKLLWDMKSYQDWFHVERVLDVEEHEKYSSKAEKEFFEGFADASNDKLSQTPAFLHKDATDSPSATSFQSVRDGLTEWSVLEAEGSTFRQAYLHDAQFVFNRVQHHVHRRDADGKHVPLSACRPKKKLRRKAKKTQKNIACKADFPKAQLLTPETVLVCQGMARRFRLRIRGKRNALGLWQGQRTDEWQSGTTPSLAVLFRSNSHTMPNYRVPPTQAIHSVTCPSEACRQHAAARQRRNPLGPSRAWLCEHSAKAQAITVDTPSKAKAWAGST